MIRRLGLLVRRLGLHRRLRLGLLALDSLLQLLHIGGGKHIPAGAAGLVRQFTVDGDDIFHQQNGHHHQLIAEANGDGAHDDAQQAGAAHPSARASPVISLDVEQLEHAVENDEGRGEDVQRLQDLFHHKELEAAQIVQEFAEGVQLLPALFRHDEDKCQYGCGNGENHRDDQKNQLLHGTLSFSMLYHHDNNGSRCCQHKKKAVRQYAERPLIRFSLR